MHGGNIYDKKIKYDFSVNLNPCAQPGQIREIKEAYFKSLEKSVNYPDINQRAFREKIARLEGLNPEEVIGGNGASELFPAILRAIQPKRVLLPIPSFLGYDYALHSLSHYRVTYYRMDKNKVFLLDEDFLIFLKEMEEKPDVIILANPNNPTGVGLSNILLEKILKYCSENKISVILDECFLRLSNHGNSMKSRIKEYLNLYVVDSFTKLFSMPGIRVGYLISARENIEAVKQQLPEWNLSAPASEIGMACADILLDNKNDFLEKTKKYIETERNYLISGLQSCGIRAFPSDANFILFYAEPCCIELKYLEQKDVEMGNVERNIARQDNTELNLYDLLLREGILIRDCSDYQGLKNGYYRIAVKSHEENQILMEKIEAIYKNKNQDIGLSQKASKSAEISEIKHLQPEDIEKESFRIIGEILAEKGIILNREQEPVIKRVIHTTADFSFAESLKFTPDAIDKAHEFIRNGATIVTDTNMGLAGINKSRLEKYDCSCRCFMAEPDVANEAKLRGVTRATVSMERAMDLEGPVIFAIGNAPTALIELNRIMTEEGKKPDFIIGVPVGFVNVEYSKELFRNSGVPSIINYGRKGGSNVAAAIVNALTLTMES